MLFGKFKKPNKFVIAILLGIFAAFLVSIFAGLWTNGLNGPQIVVAKTDIEAGAVIAKEQLSVIYWNHAKVPPNSFSDIKKLDKRAVRQKFYAGEPIIEGKLAAVGSSGGLAASISPGKRAITVRVNDVIGVAGFTLPGSYVDILVSVKHGNQDSFSRTVLTRIKVLAVAQETGTDATKPKIVNAVTLELTPEEAEKLDLARTIGTLSLSLRNEMDNLSDISDGASYSELAKQNRSGVVRESQANKILQKNSEVEIIRGLKRGSDGDVN